MQREYQLGLRFRGIHHPPVEYFYDLAGFYGASFQSCRLLFCNVHLISLGSLRRVWMQKAKTSSVLNISRNICLEKCVKSKMTKM
jgi:hypothetical protein